MCNLQAGSRVENLGMVGNVIADECGYEVIAMIIALQYHTYTTHLSELQNGFMNEELAWSLTGQLHWTIEENYKQVGKQVSDYRQTHRERNRQVGMQTDRQTDTEREMGR